MKVHFEGLWSLEIDFPQEGDEAKTYMKGDYELDWIICPGEDDGINLHQFTQFLVMLITEKEKEENAFIGKRTLGYEKTPNFSL